MIFYEVIINFFSLNFTSIEIERERVSSTLGGVCSKTNKGKQEGGRGGGGEQNSDILTERTFWMSPIEMNLGALQDLQVLTQLEVVN